MATENTATQSQEVKHLSKKTRQRVWFRGQWLQASWNYERMQNLGWCYGLIPAIKELYKDPEEQKDALKRHLEFFNTHPYMIGSIVGVELTLEEKRASGVAVDDAAIQGVKIGMMGPLAGVGDPVFWGTFRPVLGAFAASLALSGSIMGAVLFFVIWNAVRLAFLWYTQELGYKQGENITKDLSGGIMRKITMGSSVLGMFIMGVLIERWSSMPVGKVLLAKASAGTIHDKFPVLEKLFNSLSGHATDLAHNTLTGGINAAQSIASAGLQVDAAGNLWKVTTLQTVLDELLPSFLPLILTLICIWLLRRKVNPILIILGLFVIGIAGALVGIF